MSWIILIQLFLRLISIFNPLTITQTAYEKTSARRNFAFPVSFHFFFFSFFLFFLRTFFCWSRRSQCSATARLASLHGRRLAMGGGMAESTRTSLRSGGSPSTLAVPPSGSDRRLAAKVRAAAKEMRDDQRSVKAEVAAARQVAGTARARQRASKRTKLAASLLQRLQLQAQ